jgi:NAD(P)-dependent dehydrogenase (short-subunit alcohol dehydrogenase family)
VNDAVFLTGASTGIGRATALRLASRGIVVYAGVRSEADADGLRAEGGERIRPLLVEVTDSQSVEHARAIIAGAGDTRLAGIVNNAGIAVAGPLEILPAVELRRQLEVNFFAPIAIVQAFLPLLRATRGRIVNVSSIGGKFAAPFVGAYAASKFALEAASDALRIELRPAGIAVVLVEPGGVKTPIWSRSSAASAHIYDAAPPELREAYAEMLGNMQRISANMDKNGSDAEAVAIAIERGLFAKFPRARYLVGRDARVRLAVARLPDGIRDAIVARTVGARRPKPATT